MIAEDIFDGIAAIAIAACSHCSRNGIRSYYCKSGSGATASQRSQLAPIESDVTVHICVGKRVRTGIKGRELVHASEMQMMQKPREIIDDLTRVDLKRSFAVF